MTNSDPSSAPLTRTIPSVSIFLCNYNDARFLHTSLAAISMQTVCPDEVIVVDDASDDNSVEVIEHFASSAPFLTLLRNPVRRGLLYSANRALQAARGHYIVWAAADDLLLPHYLERSLAAVQEHPGAGAYVSRLAAFDDATDRIHLFNEHTQGKAFDFGQSTHFFSPAALRERLRSSYLWLSANAALMRRDLLLKHGGFDPSLRWFADWIALYNLALRYGVCVIPETLALMRQRPATYSRNRHDERDVHRALLAYLRRADNHYLYECVKECPSILSPVGLPLVSSALGHPAWWSLAWRSGRWWWDWSESSQPLAIYLKRIFVDYLASFRAA